VSSSRTLGNALEGDCHKTANTYHGRDRSRPANGGIVPLLKVLAASPLRFVVLILAVTSLVWCGRGTVTGIRYWDASETPERLAPALEDLGWERDADAAYFFLSHTLGAQSWTLRRLERISPCRAR